jgi:hypothetical protein
VAEGYVEAILDPEARIAKLRAEGAAGAGGASVVQKRVAAIEARLGEVERGDRMRILEARRELVEDGVPVESYRRIGLDEALGLLAPERAG